jgi:hypothetical protein
MLGRFANPAWQREATAAEEDRILGLLESELAAGALGVGVLLGYAARTSPGEYLRVARLAAARHRCPSEDPSAEPICAIGPSRPTDPPPPMQIADANDFMAATAGRMRPPFSPHPALPQARNPAEDTGPNN